MVDPVNYSNPITKPDTVKAKAQPNGSEPFATILGDQINLSKQAMTQSQIEKQAQETGVALRDNPGVYLSKKGNWILND